MLAILFSVSQIYASELIVKGKIDVPFSVFINGEKYYSYNSQVNITNLPRGYYNMQIYTEGATYELLYDCRIEIPRNEIVTATFTGDNQIYISSARIASPVVLHVTPYPHRSAGYSHPHSAPRPIRVVHSKPKKTTYHSNGSSHHKESSNRSSTNNSKRSSNSSNNTNQQKSSRGDGQSTRTLNSNK